MIFLLGVLTLLAAAHGGGTHSVKGGPSYGQKIIQETHVIDDTPKPYSFGYEAGGPYVQSTREEVADPLGRVQGTYTVSDPRGHTRQVHYTADEGGFVADVHTNEPNIKTHAPANAQIISVAGKGSSHLLDPVSQVHDATHSALHQAPIIGSSGPGNIQFTLGDSQALGDFDGISRNPLYKIGLSQIPFGLSGLDYYSFPAQMYAPRRRVKTVVSKSPAGIGGLSGIGALAAGKGGVIAGSGPGNIQFTLGDPQGLTSRGPLYTIGQSRIPFGLSGLDYYSFPARMYNQQRRVKTVLSKASHGVGSLGGIGALAAGRKGGAAIAGPGNIQFTLGDPAVAAGFGGVSQDPLYTIGRSQIPYGLSGLDYYSFPSQMYNRPRRVKTVLSKASHGVGSLGGIGALAAGRKGGAAIAGPGSIQFTLGDPDVAAGFGGVSQDPLYTIGRSQIPYGLSGLDYYSFPAQMYNRPRRVKTVLSKASHGVGSLGGIGALAAGRKGGAAIAGPGNIQFTLGDPAVAAGFGGVSQDPLYTIGRSQIPYGLSGLDYYSFPAQMYNRPRRVKTVLSKASHGVGSLGGIGALAAGRKGGAAIAGPGNIQFTLGDPDVAAGFGGVSQGPLYTIGQSRIPYGLSGLDYYSFPARMYNQRRRVLSKASAGGVGSLGGIGALGKGAALVSGSGPGNIQFTLGDPQAVKGFSGVSSRGPLYTIGQSRIPFGLSGLDYYSFPAQLYNQRRVLSKASRGIGSGLGIGAIRKAALTDGTIIGGQQATLVDIDPAVSGIGGAPGSIQFTLGDSSLQGVRNVVYRDGQSRVPFGLSGSDYYSYPAVMLGKSLSGKASTGISSPFASRLRSSPAGLIRDIQEDIVDDAVVIDPVSGGVSRLGDSQKLVQVSDIGSDGGPGSIQFTLGDPQLGLTSGLGRPYKIRQSSVPYGLSGLDYYSYPAKLYTPRRVKTTGLSGAGALVQRQIQERIAGPTLGRQAVIDPGLGVGPGNIQFTLGAPAVAAVAGPSYGQRKIVTPVLGDAGASPGNIQFTLGEPQLGLRKQVIEPQVGYIEPAFGTGGIGGGVVRVAPVRKIQKQVIRTQDVGVKPISFGGPNIQFTLGGSQVIGGPAAAIGSRPSLGLAPVTQARVSPAQVIRSDVGAGPDIHFALGEAVGGAPRVVSGRPAVGLRRVAQRRIVPARTTATRGTAGAGPIIEFNLGDAQIVGGHSGAAAAGRVAPVQVVEVGAGAVRRPSLGLVRVPERRVAQAEVIDAGGIGPGIEFTLGDPTIDLARTSPARVTQQRVANIVDGARPGIQFTLGDTQIVGGPAVVAAGRPLGTLARTSQAKITQDQIAGPGIAQVTETVEPVSLTSGGYGLVRKRVIEKFQPRVSFASPFSYDAPFDITSPIYGGPGLQSKISTFGLRTSAIKADPSLLGAGALGQQKITTVIGEGPLGPTQVLQEKVDQVLVR